MIFNTTIAGSGGGGGTGGWEDVSSHFQYDGDCEVSISAFKRGEYILLYAIMTAETTTYNGGYIYVDDGYQPGETFCRLPVYLMGATFDYGSDGYAVGDFAEYWENTFNLETSTQISVGPSDPPVFYTAAYGLY